MKSSYRQVRALKGLWSCSRAIYGKSWCLPPSSLVNNSSAVAEMGDRLAAKDTGRKFRGGAPFLEVGGMGWAGSYMYVWCDTMWPEPRPTFVPSGILIRLATINTGRIVGTVPLLRAESPSNTMWLRPSPTCVLSFILIRPSVWPQCTNVTDRTDRQTERQRSDSIGRTVLQTVAQKVSGKKLNRRQKELVKPDCARVCGSEQYCVIIAVTIVWDTPIPHTRFVLILII